MGVLYIAHGFRGVSGKDSRALLSPNSVLIQVWLAFDLVLLLGINFPLRCPLTLFFGSACEGGNPR
jgi:hypothetical protein